MTRPCRIDGCTKAAQPRRRLCSMHKQRIALHGDPDFTTWTHADETEVELLVRDPRPVWGLTRLEQRLIAQGLTQRGTTASEIARILHVDPRTVHRWRATDRTAA